MLSGGIEMVHWHKSTKEGLKLTRIQNLVND